MIYIIIIVLVFFIIFYNFLKQPILVEGLYTFNGRMAVDDQYFYDKLFDNVTYYPNQYDKDYKTAEEVGKLVSTGWVRCLEECPGRCVEYGLTGASYCFSK
jgi:hypothetical protein